MKSFGRKSSRFGKSAWPGGDELLWRIAGDVITGHYRIVHGPRKNRHTM